MPTNCSIRVGRSYGGRHRSKSQIPKYEVEKREMGVWSNGRFLSLHMDLAYI
jgi:hypothetical protein